MKMNYENYDDILDRRRELAEDFRYIDPCKFEIVQEYAFGLLTTMAILNTEDPQKIHGAILETIDTYNGECFDRNMIEDLLMNAGMYYEDKDEEIHLNNFGKELLEVLCNPPKEEE